MIDRASRHELEESVSEPGESIPVETVHYERTESVDTSLQVTDPEHRVSDEEWTPRPDHLPSADLEAEPRHEESSLRAAAAVEEELIVGLPVRVMQELKERARQENLPARHVILKLLGERRESMPPLRRRRPRDARREMARYLLLSQLLSR
jgi:hypothetical protein